MTINAVAALAVLVFGSGAGVLPEEGLLAWFNANEPESLFLDGDRVVAWGSRAEPDLVANVSGVQQPTYRARSEGKLRPAVYFSGTDAALVAPLNRKLDTWSLVIVAAPYAPCGGGGLCSANPVGGNDFDPGFTVDLYQSGPSFDQISVEGAGRIGGQIDQMRSSLPCGGMHVISVIRGPKQVDVYVDGKLEGSRPVNPAQTVADELRIGARHYDGGEKAPFHGEIAQVLLYDRALDENDRMAAEGCFKVSDEERREGEQAIALEKERRRRERMLAPTVVQSWPSIEAFVKEQGESLNPAALPIRTDLREAIELSVRHLNSLYDWGRDNEPFFYVNRQADGTGKMHHSVNIGIPHVVGRCLLGCMVAELDSGVHFPDEGLAVLERYCRSSFDNPDNLNSYYDPARGGARFVEFHNMREGLYGLWALIAGRDSEWAREKAHAMLVTLDRITTQDGLWSPDLAKQAGMLERCEGVATPNASRMVDALLAYYDATQDPLAMKLAGLYARQGVKTVFKEDGHFAPMDQSSGHVHSITSSLSGITAYAVRTNDAAMLAHCRRIMDVGVPEYFSSWGWGDEVYPEHPADVVSRGEINQTGDVVRTGLILGEAGYPDYYDVAERYLRSMILPTQHREKELRAILRDKPDPADDSERDTVMRSVGGYAMQLPNDRMREGDWPISTLDITSGAVHAMSECHRQRTTVRDGVYRMNLLFDFEDDALSLDSQLPAAGAVAIGAKKDLKGVEIRIPKWVNPDTIHVTVAGETVSPKFEGSYVHIGPLSAGAEGRVSFDVPCNTETETVDGVKYTTTWVGNQIIRIEPRGNQSPLPF